MDQNLKETKKTNEKMPIYKFGRGFLGLIYKLWYRPTIIGKENIPTEGSFLIVGNHIHIMDQCNVIIATKRCIHYMAKKEYFDPKYKEGKFPWFFRGAGCIPVDRSKKDEEAMHAALDVLEKGEVLGLFPEGTRNGLKEERAKEIYEEYVDKNISFEDFYKKAKKNKTTHINYLEELMKDKTISRDEFLDNLTTADDLLQDLILNGRITKEDYYEHSFLPLKFGAVSMAKKTSSPIVPYIITGHYKFRSKDLKILIGKPLDPQDDLEKANYALRETFKKLLKESLENNEK